MNLLAAAPIIPLIQAEDPKIAVKTAEALKAGGLTVLEVVWRTDAAMDCMEAIIAEVPSVTVGAGTVLSKAQAIEAAGRGAQFIVSPGLSQDVVEYCQGQTLEIYPGTATPSEVQLARNLGLRTVKFFPASLVGGAPMLKALASVYPDMQFMPTGGVKVSNLRDFLSIPAVIACGGSWLTPAAEIAAGNFAAITALAGEALGLAREIKSEL